MVSPDDGSRERIKEVLRRCSNKRPQKGESVFVVYLPWYNQLLEWVENENKPAPGPIDLSAIVSTQDTGKLAIGKFEGFHVKTIDRELWDTLLKELGSADGTQPIQCPMLSNNKAELYPMDLFVHMGTGTSNAIPTQASNTRKIQISRLATVRELKAKFAISQNVSDVSSVKLSRFTGHQTQGSFFADDNAVLEDLNVINETKLLAQIQISASADNESAAADLIKDFESDDDDDDDLPDPKLREWRPSSSKSTASNVVTYGSMGGGSKRNFHDMNSAGTAASSTTAASAMGGPSLQRNRGNGYLSNSASAGAGGIGGYSSLYSMQSVAPGVCGLRNLGNTCFMNSSLQCISNVASLARYFLGDEHLHELNRESPIGCKGELAEAFGALLHELWSGKNKTVAPVGVKETAGKFAPRFQGYQQQDSQEFLEFFLDGLHEDLNRILDRPLVEAVDDASIPDTKAAALAWEGHKKRNDSVIVDLFQGQYKSTLTCPKCSKVSIKFDPYMSLTLPIPNKEVARREVVLIGLTGKRTKYSVLVPKGGSACAKHVHDALLTLLRARGVVGSAETAATAVGAVADDGSTRAETTASGVLQILSFEGRLHREGLTTLGPEDALPDEYYADLMALYIPAEHVAKGTRVVALMVRNTNNGGHTSEVGGPFALVLNNADGAVPDGHVPPIPRSDLVHRINTAFSAVLVPSVTAETLKPPASVAVLDDDTKGQNQAERAVGRRTLARAVAINEDMDKNGLDGVASEDAVARVGCYQLPETTIRYTSGERSVTLTPNVPLGAQAQGGGDGTVDDDMQGGTDAINADALPSPTSTVFLDLPSISRARAVLQPNVQAQCDTDVSCASRNDLCDTSSTLDECFELFQREEVLGADNMWYCPQCKEHQCAQKRMELWTLPEVLIVHLKRFSQDRWHRRKVTTMVDFPFEGLDLGRHLRGPAGDGQHVYELTGVVNHTGYMGGGHYTANARNFESNAWYNFDDSYVMPEDRRHSKTAASYVLFYQRTSTSS
eukprot:m.113969 g.113969  ORF g.113969 m.113969 type:complete len:1012 (+) comp17112_c0_seq1:122-3157(+)